jgi:DNA modification methylase
VIPCRSEEIKRIIGHYKNCLVDFTEEYSNKVVFSSNARLCRHRWYSFREGFSSELVQGFILENKSHDIVCLDPFSGCGTTALTCQELGIKCYSIEVNPFLYTLTKTKLWKDYSIEVFDECLDFTSDYCTLLSDSDIIIPPMKTIVQKENLQKWLFHRKILYQILKVKKSISEIGRKEYEDLFTIMLSSILVEFSNVYKNGKCHAYKKNWKDLVQSNEEVMKRFNERAEIFRRDIRKSAYGIDNSEYCIKGDVRECIDKIRDNSINTIITSPPYLNSKDYTDSYMIELWVLGFIESYKELRALRDKTIRSHVQVPLEREESKHIIIKEIARILEERKKELWNKDIPSMITAYFSDMEYILAKMHSKLKKGGRMYLNVANSAYYGMEVPTDIILADICGNIGFEVEQIRIARFLRTSAQQMNGTNGTIERLRESIVILRKI